MESIGLVSDVGGYMPSNHPTDKDLLVFTNGADHFVCPIPTGHERFREQPVIRKATEEECKHHRLVYIARQTAINNAFELSQY